MTEAPPEQVDLPRLRRRIAASFALAWLTALGVLLAVAMLEGQRRRLEQLDTELQLRATVAYGMAWFDADGTLRVEVLEVEPWADDPRYPMRILDPLPPHEVLWGPTLHRDLQDELQLELGRISAQFQPRLLGDHLGRRVHAIPMYADDTNEVVGLAMVTRDLAELRAEQRAYSWTLVTVFVGLAALGLVVAWQLARMSVGPLERQYRARARFLGAAAHELRTPLSSLRAVAESGAAGDEAPTEALARIQRIAEQASDRVDALLWHARLSSGEATARRVPTRVDLLAQSVAEAFPHAEVSEAPVTAEVDGILLGVALQNLLHNAERHAEAAAGRGVRVEVVEGQLRVEDRGPGYPDGMLEASNLRSAHPEGAGLGLSVARLVAEQHGGTLRLQRTPAGGARAVLSWR